MISISVAQKEHVYHIVSGVWWIRKQQEWSRKKINYKTF